MNTTIFTPRIKGNEPFPGETMKDGRAVMQLTRTDQLAWIDAKLNNSTTTVTDQTTGTRWLVNRADCGLGCMCAAEAEAVVPAPTERAQ